MRLMNRLMWVGAMILMVMMAGCRPPSASSLLRDGVDLAKQGNYGQSLRVFQKAIRTSGNNADLVSAHNCLGIVYLKIGQRDNAIHEFEMATGLDPQRAEPVYNLGAVLYENGNEADAMKCFEKASRLDINDPRALEYMSMIAAKRQQFGDARQFVEEALQRVPRSPRALTALSLIELQGGDLENAVVHLQQALEQDADYPPALYNLAVVYQRHLKNTDQAVTYYKEFMRRSSVEAYKAKALDALREISRAGLPAVNTATRPASSPVLPTPMPVERPTVTLPPEKPVETQAVAAVSSTPPGVPPPAAPQQTSAPVVIPAPAPAPVPPPPSFDDLMRIARLLEQQGRREASVNNYLLAVKEADRAGKPNWREQAMREAISAASDDGRANYQMGRFLLDRKQPADAMMHLKQAGVSNPGSFEVQLALADAAIGAEEFDTVRVSVKQAEQVRSGSADDLWKLAQLCDRNPGLADLSALYYVEFVRKYAGDARASQAKERLSQLPTDVVALAEKSDKSLPSTNRPSVWNRLFHSGGKKQ